MTEMRDGFKETITGWLLVDSFAAVSEYIEAAARWVQENGGETTMTPNERRTVELMIERQLVLAEAEGIGIFTPPDAFGRKRET